MALPSDEQSGGAAVTPFPEDRLVDAKLVRDAARGDRRALGAAWDRYAKLVRGVIVSVLGPDSAVDDLVQEVFIAFHRGASRIEDGRALRGYLVAVAVRLGALEIRRRKVRRWVGLSKTGETPDIPVSEADAEARESLRAFYRVVDNLSSRRRLVFTLRHVRGLEFSEIAAAVDISESTVRRELRRAERQVTALSEREPSLVHYLAKRHASGRPRVEP